MIYRRVYKVEEDREESTDKVIVKQGGSLREVTRVYITRLRGKTEAEGERDYEGGGGARDCVGKSHS